MRKARDFKKEEEQAFIEDLKLYTDIYRSEDNSFYYFIGFAFIAFIFVYLIVSL